MTILKKRNGKRGFTLAELIIVVAVMAILAGLAFLFINPKDISYVEYNRSAEAIATAVQNRLTEIRNAGDMSELRDLGESVAAEGTPTSDQEGGGYRYIFNFIQNADGTTLRNPDIAYLVPFGTIDLELAENYYAIGFQSDTGMVGEVWYSTKPFTATASYLKSLDAEKLKAADIGYYKGEVNDAELAFANLPTPQLTITNHEELTLRIYLPEVKQLEMYGKKLGIVVSLTDEDGKALGEKGMTLLNTAIYATFPVGEASAKDDPKSAVVTQDIQSGESYQIVLDTVKKFGDSEYLGEMKRELSDTPTGRYEDWAEKTAAYTEGDDSSPLLLGDNAIITVSVYCLRTSADGDKYNENFPIDTTFMPRTASVTFNGWFNSYRSSSVEIACGRHLQNLAKLTKLTSNLERYLPTVAKDRYGDYIKGTSGYEYGDYNYGMADAYTDGTSNGEPAVDYDDITVKYERRKGVKSITKATQIDAIDFDCEEWQGISFIPINPLPEFTYEGQYLTINHLKVDAPFYAGLFGYAYHAKLYDILIVNPSITSEMPAHLAELYEMGVGGLIGTSRHSSDIYNCQTYMTQEGSEYHAGDYRVQGSCYVGGLIGFGEDEDIANCSASVYTGYEYSSDDSVYTKYVGGLIGCITGDGNVESCYAAGNLTGQYVGGLIGLIVEDSDSSGDDYRIHTCYTAGHIEYASKSAAGLLGHISELAGNVRSALSAYENYCVVIYGRDSGHTWPTMATEGGDTAPVPIYGTFRGDGFEWLRTDDLGFSDTYLTGTYAGESFFAGASFKDDNKNYFIKQKGITYCESPYYTAMNKAVQELLTDIENSSTSSATAIQAKVKAAQEKIVWLKKLQALEDLRAVMEEIVYRVDSETGKDPYGHLYNEGGVRYDSGTGYEYSPTIYLDTDRARIEGSTSHNKVALTAVQAIHVIYCGTYTDSNGNIVALNMKYSGSDTQKKKLNKDTFGGVFTFMDYYNFLKAQYNTLLSSTATEAEKTAAKNNLKEILGDGSKETYTTVESGKEKIHNFYEAGLFYRHFYSDLLYRLFDKGKDYYQYYGLTTEKACNEATKSQDLNGELIYRYFRGLAEDRFREVMADIGMDASQREEFLLRTKIEAVESAITTLGDDNTIFGKWTGKMAGKKTEAQSYASGAKSKLEALKGHLTATTSKETLKKDIDAADAELKKLYDLLDSGKVPSTIPDGEKKEDYYDVVDKNGKTGDMRTLRDPIAEIRRDVALCIATSGSGVDAALDIFARALGESGANVTALLNDFTTSVNATLGANWNYTDSGHRVTNAEQLRNVIRGFPYGSEDDERGDYSLNFFYDYGNSDKSSSGNQKNPYYGSLENGSYVDLNNGVHNNVFPYNENAYTAYYPFPFVYARKTQNNDKLVTYILFHYGDWLTEDLWDKSGEALAPTPTPPGPPAPTMTASKDAVSEALTTVSDALEGALNEAGASETTGKVKNAVTALAGAIDNFVTEANDTMSAMSKADLEKVQTKISDWLTGTGKKAVTIPSLEALVADEKNNEKAVVEKLNEVLPTCKQQLQSLLASVNYALKNL